MLNENYLVTYPMLNQKSLHINIEYCNKILHIATLKEIQRL